VTDSYLTVDTAAFQAATPSGCKDGMLNSRDNLSLYSELVNYDSFSDPLQIQALNILVSLLKTSGSRNTLGAVRDAVKKIDGLCPTGNSEEPGRRVEDFLWNLWEVLVEVVKATPFDHPYQALLVDFLTVLHQKRQRTATIWGVCVIHSFLQINPGAIVDSETN
jgi:hypothetical protein